MQSNIPRLLPNLHSNKQIIHIGLALNKKRYIFIVIHFFFTFIYIIQYISVYFIKFNNLSIGIFTKVLYTRTYTLQ